VIHDAFASVDSHEKAYLLGFLAADGCLIEPGPRRPNWRLDLKIKAVDIQACQSLQRIAGGSLFLIEGGYRAVSQVCSSRIAADLIALGITPRKTLTLSLAWDAISVSFHGAVLAGLIDGDGSLDFKAKARRARISLVTASAALKDQLLDRFPFFKVIEECPFAHRKTRLYRLIVESNRALLRTLIAQVYTPLTCPILERKRAVLDRILVYLDQQDAYEERMEEVPALWRSGMSQRDIAAHLGTSLRPVQARLRQAGIDGRVAVFTSNDIREMRALHKRGFSVQQIHIKMGKATAQAVRYHLQQLGCIEQSHPAPARHPLAEKIVALHHAGLPVYQIAEEVHLGVGIVSRVLRQTGISLCSGSPVKLTQAQIEVAAAALDAGRTLASVAEDLGVSTTLVRLRVKERR
jgi:hypothetical protein